MRLPDWPIKHGHFERAGERAVGGNRFLRPRTEEKDMIKVAVEVRSGAARTAVAVTAESIERAMSLVAGRFPGKTYKVKFPIEAEDFFVGGLSEADMVVQPEKLAA
jgi:hypothetical protein